MLLFGTLPLTKKIMKTSPLQLKWLTYPEASYELSTEFDGDTSAPIDVDVDAQVRYALDGAHSAFVCISSKDDAPAAYKFKVTALAGFSFDLDIAKEAYKPKSATGLPPVIAVNVARVLYSSAREQLAMLTSRAPYSSVMLKSVLLEPRDVEISSPDSSPVEVLREVFRASEEELLAIVGRKSDSEATSRSPKKPSSAASKKKV